jgi:hypothetical protein
MKMKRNLLRAMLLMVILFSIGAGSLVHMPAVFAQAVTENIRTLTSAGQPIVWPP